jgi:hypothetical protein
VAGRYASGSSGPVPAWLTDERRFQIPDRISFIFAELRWHSRNRNSEAIAQKNGYVRRHSNGKFSGFVADVNIEKAEAYFQQWYGSDALPWLDKFRFKTNDEPGIADHR